MSEREWRVYAHYVKFRAGRNALGPVFPLFAPCDRRGHLQPGNARAERHLRHPDVGPVQGRNPLGLRFLRRFRLARTVEGDRLANERLEGGLVNFFSFGDVDRAACVSVETRVEETGRILQRRARRATKSECPSTSSPRPRLGLLS